MPQLLPHGWYSLLPPVLATMAWTSALFQDGCDFVRIKGSVVQALADSDAPFLEAGFDAYREPRYNPSQQTWELVYSGACLEYPTEPVDINADAYWQMSKFFDFAATVLGGAGAFFLWFSTACVFSPGTWRWTGYEIFFAAFFQGMSFLWLRNDLCHHQTNNNNNNESVGDAPNENDGGDTVCEFSWGAKMDVVAGCLWLFAAMLIFCHYPQAVDEWVNDDDDENEDDDVLDEDDMDEGQFEDIQISPTHDGFGSSIKDDSFESPAAAGQFTGEAPYEDGRRPTMAQIV